MKSWRLGLQGKFIISLLIAAALPFVCGLLALETFGYRRLLAERGKFHQLEAGSLLGSLNQASDAQASQLRTWLAADRTIDSFLDDHEQLAATKSQATLAEETTLLDKAWPTLPIDDPRVLAITANQASASLCNYQQLHPEVAEILLADSRGRLVAASGKSSDVEQADEAWWQQGAATAPGGSWTDELRWDESAQVFSLDLVLPVHHGKLLRGVIKLSEDVSTRFQQLPMVGDTPGVHRQIVLADGRVLAGSQAGFVTLKDRLQPLLLKTLHQTRSGWTIASDENNEQRMMGFVTLENGRHEPAAFIVFSSLCDDVVAPLQRLFLWLGVIGTSLLAVCTLAGYLLVRRNILQPLAALGHAARTISATARLKQPHDGSDAGAFAQRKKAEADLEKIRAIHTGDEVEALAGDLAVMTSRVLRYHRELEAEVAAKTAVIREDLEMAREFQQALLPSKYPLVPPDNAGNPLRLAFAHFYQPASTVGGDFFDLIELDGDRAGILIADVMGHGARSALVTAILRALVRNLSAESPDPGQFLGELNRHLHELIARSGQTLFVTAFLLVLDTRQATASWAVAGHPAPLRVRRGSGMEPQPLWSEPQRQPALGLLPDAVFRTEQARLHAGEVFLLYTDGVYEAENPDQEPFGMERLVRSFDEALDGPMAAMPAKIVCDVSAFQRRNQCDDDICIVAVEALAAARPADKA